MIINSYSCFTDSEMENRKILHLKWFISMVNLSIGRAFRHHEILNVFNHNLMIPNVILEARIMSLISDEIDTSLTVKKGTLTWFFKFDFHIEVFLYFHLNFSMMKLSCKLEVFCSWPVPKVLLDVKFRFFQAINRF